MLPVYIFFFFLPVFYVFEGWLFLLTFSVFSDWIYFCPSSFVDQVTQTTDRFCCSPQLYSVNPHLSCFFIFFTATAYCWFLFSMWSPESLDLLLPWQWTSSCVCAVDYFNPNIILSACIFIASDCTFTVRFFSLKWFYILVFWSACSFFTASYGFQIQKTSCMLSSRPLMTWVHFSV